MTHIWMLQRMNRVMNEPEEDESDATLVKIRHIDTYEYQGPVGRVVHQQRVLQVVMCAVAN